MIGYPLDRRRLHKDPANPGVPWQRPGIHRKTGGHPFLFPVQTALQYRRSLVARPLRSLVLTACSGVALQP